MYYLQVSLESSPPLNLILEPSLQMTPQPKAEYTDLPLELRETLSQYLDIKTLIALGACDPYILKRTFTKHLLQTTFKKTHLSETTELCTFVASPIVTWTTDTPPFPTQIKYNSAYKYNQEVIGDLLELIDNIHAANYTQEPFLRKNNLAQLTQFIIEHHPPYESPYGWTKYDFYNSMAEMIYKNNSCTLCCPEQAVNIEFVYNNRTYCTSLDGWNLLCYSNAQVEFKECIGYPHPLEFAYSPIVGEFDGEYRFPQVSGHNLVYRSMISGQELKEIYDNIKRHHPNNLNEILYTRTRIELTINTVIVYSLEGAQVLFAMKEDPRVILRYKTAIYDPRQGQVGITAPCPTPIFLNEKTFTLQRVIQSPSCKQAETIWTVYHLNRNLVWKRINKIQTPGNYSNSQTRMEITNLKPPPCFEPLKERKNAIRRIITQDTIVSNRNVYRNDNPQ